MHITIINVAPCLRNSKVVDVIDIESGCEFTVLIDIRQYYAHDYVNSHYHAGSFFSFPPSRAWVWPMTVHGVQIVFQ